MDIIVLTLQLLAILLMCLVLIRMLAYLRIQVTYYYHSKHIERFLDKKGVSAEKYIEENCQIWRQDCAKAPYRKGGGTRAFVWALLCRAREDIAIRNFEKTDWLSQYCFCCYFYLQCSLKYHLTCSRCVNPVCDMKSEGRDRICRKFECVTRFEDDCYGKAED